MDISKAQGLLLRLLTLLQNDEAMVAEVLDRDPNVRESATRALEELEWITEVLEEQAEQHRLAGSDLPPGELPELTPEQAEELAARHGNHPGVVAANELLALLEEIQNEKGELVVEHGGPAYPPDHDEPSERPGPE